MVGKSTLVNDTFIELSKVSTLSVINHSRMKLEKGQVYSIRTIIGYGFIQYIEADRLGIEYVRILDPIKEFEEINQEEINRPQRWCCGFPLKAALNRKLVNDVGSFQLPPKYKVEFWTRCPHNVQGEHLGWFLINRETLERKFKNKLRKKHLKLSPHGVFNDTLIRERLEQNWNLVEWEPFD